MATKPDIWMPLFIGDYLADTSRLTTEQHGAYLLIIMDYWRNGPPPDNDSVLASIAKASPQAWKKIKPELVFKFKIAGGKWNHGRIDRELLDAEEGREKARKKAKKGAEARWQKPKEDALRTASSDAPSIAPSTALGSAPSSALGTESSNAQEMLDLCPSPSPTQIKKKPSQKPSTAFAVPYGIDPEIWASYLGTRRKKRASNDPVALKLVVEQLERLRCRGHDPAVVIGNSVRAGYGDVFEPTGNNGNGHINGGQYKTAKTLEHEQRKEWIDDLTGKSKQPYTIDIASDTVD